MADNTGPRLAASPYEALCRPAKPPTTLQKVFWPILNSSTVFAGCTLANWYYCRPLFSNISKFITLGGGTLLLSFWYNSYIRDPYLAEKDAVLRHYVLLHPDDFPPYPRVKIGEIFEPWMPIR